MMNEIIFADKFFPLVKNGTKTTTVRAGHRDYTFNCLYDIYNPDKTVHDEIYVLSIAYTTFGKLTEETAKTDGFASLNELKNELLQFYPELTNDSDVTIVYFEYDMGKEKKE